mgnify:CR=1 FL=1
MVGCSVLFAKTADTGVDLGFWQLTQLMQKKSREVGSPGAEVVFGIAREFYTFAITADTVVDLGC